MIVYEPSSDLEAMPRYRGPSAEAACKAAALIGAPATALIGEALIERRTATALIGAPSSPVGETPGAEDRGWAHRPLSRHRTRAGE